MALSRIFGVKTQEKTGTNRAHVVLAVSLGLAAEIRTLTARIDDFERAFRALDAFRIALEAKTWIAFRQHRSGQVAGGCARAASAKRDEHGRYLGSTSQFLKDTAATVRRAAGLPKQPGQL